MLHDQLKLRSIECSIGTARTRTEMYCFKLLQYGVSRLMVNENLTEERIEKVVKLNANSTFPVPTRLLPPDRNESLDSYHRDAKIVYVYDGVQFSGKS